MKPSIKTIETLRQLVDVLFEADFDEALRDKYNYGVYGWEGDHEYLVEKFSLKFYYGATKVGVVLGAEEDWIVKFPFECEDDFCELELENYNKAVSQGMSQYFPETYLLSDFGNKTIILQERVECNDYTEDSISSLLEKSAREVLFSDGYIDEHTSKYDADDKIMDYVWEMNDYERVMAVFGNEALADFIDETGINDLHCGNIGLKDGKPIIIDFSGF